MKMALHTPITTYHQYHHPPTTNLMSAISQLLLTQFLPKFKQYNNKNNNINNNNNIFRKSTIWKARIKKKDEILWRQEYWKERTIILIFSITATTLMGCDTIEINQIFRPKRIKYSVANLIFLDLNFESWHIGAALLHKNGVPKRRNFCAKFSRRIHFHQILVVWESLSRDF